MHFDASQERTNLLVLAVAWTLFVALGVWLGLDLVAKSHDEILLNEARAYFDMDVAFRRWGAMHGGVYVPATDVTPPNPYLSHVTERDFTTPSGRELTLVNPAYMHRQLHEQFPGLYRFKGHITSLDPLRPENKPDPWERKALESFGKGTEEQREINEIDGVPHLRLMRPIFVVASCLKCHAEQGYELGDVRGGISVSVDATTHLGSKRRTINAFALNSGAAWLLGLGVIAWYGSRTARRTKERDQALHALLRSNQALRTISQCNETLVTATDEAQLMERICQGVVESGGYDFAWVGVQDDDEAAPLRPVAYAGEAEGLMEGLKAAWPEVGSQSCMAAEAIRTGRPVAGEPGCGDECGCGELAHSHGLRTGMALPLEGGGRVFGALAILSRDPEAFGPDETALLTELSKDLAFGITALHTRRELDRRSLDLDSARKSFNTLFSTARDAVFILSPERIVDCNRSAQEMLGAPLDVILATHLGHYLPQIRGESHDEAAQLLKSVLDKGLSRALECELRTHDGRTLFAEVGVNRIELETGAFIQAVVRDVTERTATLRALEESQHRLAEAQRIAAIGDWVWNADGSLSWSDEVYRIFGITREEFDDTYESFLDMVYPDDRDAVDITTRRVLDRGGVYELKHRILHPRGIRFVHERAISHPEPDNGAVLMSGTVQDITDQVNAQFEIEALHRRSDLILQSAGDGIFGLDGEGRIEFANPTGASLLGRSRRELVGTALADYAVGHDLDTGEDAPLLAAPLGDGQCAYGRRTFKRTQGDEFPADLVVTPIMDEDGVAGAVVALRDVTHQVQAQERQARDLREKETLLKEIHHRVKNNMQIISSLLSLQSNDLHDERDKALVRESMDRVRSMAFVHESLYRDGDLSSVDFANYLREVGAHLHHIYSGPGPSPVKIETRLDEVRLDIVKAVPCGLIANELLTNAFKHAFAPGGEGLVVLALETDNGAARMFVEDDGAGMDPALFETGESFGLTLIRSLAAQVNADIEVVSDGGTRVTVTIPLG